MTKKEPNDDFDDDKFVVEVLLQAFADLGNVLKTVTDALSGAWKEEKHIDDDTKNDRNEDEDNRSGSK